MAENCPCEAVRELKEIVSRHDRQLCRDNTEFAEIQKDLQYIRENLDKKNKIGMTTVSAIIQAICTIIVTLTVSRLGFL